MILIHLIKNAVINITIFWLIIVLLYINKKAIFRYMKNEFSINFGKRIKYFRNIARLSQEQLAEKMGLSTNTISYIESGKNNISFAKLPKLCKILNIEPYQLFIFDNDKPDADRMQETVKILESMSDKQLGITYKLILNLANLRPEDVHGPIK